MVIDDEQRRHLEDLLRTHRANLRHLEKQAAKFGDMYVPLPLQNGIADEKDEIARIDKELGANVAPGPPVRSASPPPRQAPVESVPSPQVSIDRTGLRRLWWQALTAFFTKDWERAEMLLVQVVEVDPNYEDVQTRLTEARRRLRLDAFYRQIGELREDDQWEAVLGALDELEREQPGYSDRDGLRVWAEGRKRRKLLYDEALVACDHANWTAAIAALEALLAEFPDDDEAKALLTHARAEQQVVEEAAERQRREAVERTRQELFGGLLAHIQAENFVAALKLLETLLKQQPRDREATVLVAGLIENSHVPLEQRLRAGRLAGQMGDPRPGVCTLEPAWCGPFPAGEYPIADGRVKVQLSEFRTARYPVTVWQFRQFYEDGGYRDDRWWTPEGRKWKHNKPIITQPNLWNEPDWTEPNQPVIGVSWYEAVAFCNWLTERGKQAGWLKPGQVVWLPSEAEWEVAAMWDVRTGLMRPWQPSQGEVWQNVQEAGIERTSPVGMFPQGASPCGALDMAGNVWEWCSSAYRGYPKSAARLREDFSMNNIPSLRGGSYYLQSKSSACGARYWGYPYYRDYYNGFRVIWSLRAQK